MKFILSVLCLFLFSGIVSAYKVVDIPLFPEIGDCLKYYPLDRQTPPRFMECSTPDGDKFSVPINSFDRDVGVGSEADLPLGLQPAAKVVDVPPITIVFYLNKRQLFSSAVMYEQKGSDFLTGIKPVLVLGGHLTPWRLQYYGVSCDNWVTVPKEGSFCDPDVREGVPPDFPYYVFTIHSGGNHCCFHLFIVDKESPHHVLYEFDGGMSAPRFKDVDDDGRYEMVVRDYDSYTYELYGPGFVPLPPDIIWHMTPFGLYVAPELMSKPMPSAASLANYKKSINDESGGDDQLLYEVTLDLIYSGHEKEAWKFFDDAWPEFFKYWSRYDQWDSEEMEEFYRKQFRDEFVKDICNSLFARSLSWAERNRFMGQTCSTTTN